MVWRWILLLMWDEAMNDDVDVMKVPSNEKWCWLWLCCDYGWCCASMMMKLIGCGKCFLGRRRRRDEGGSDTPRFFQHLCVRTTASPVAHKFGTADLSVSCCYHCQYLPYHYVINIYNHYALFMLVSWWQLGNGPMFLKRQWRKEKKLKWR